MKKNNKKNKGKYSVQNTFAEVVEPGFIAYEHDGFVYHLPETEITENIQFNGLNILLSRPNTWNFALIMGGHRDIVALTPDNTYKMSVSLKVIVDDDLDNKPCYAKCALYNKKNPRPLFVEDMFFNEDEIFYSSVNLIELPPGDYFFLFTGVESYGSCYYEMENMGLLETYHFTIKKHGSTLKHPNLEHKLAENEPLLVLKPLSGKLKSADVYHYVCYNRVYRVMYNRICELENQTLMIPLIDIMYPLDDKYTVVLYHNNEPFMVYSYTLLNKQIHHLTATPIQQGTHIHALTQIEHHMNESNFALQPGFLPVKNYILDILSGKVDLGNLMVLCSDLPSKDFIEGMMNILHGEDEYTVINVMELAQQWRGKFSPDIKHQFEKKAVVLQNLSVLLHPNYLALLAALDMYINMGDVTYYLIDKAETINQIAEHLTHSGDTFTSDHRIVVPDYEPADQVTMIADCLLENQYKMTGNSMIGLNNLIIREEEIFSHLDSMDIERWVEHTILPHLSGLVKKKSTDDDEDDDDGEPDSGYYVVPIDFEAINLPANPSNSYMECLDELNALVGLDNLKISLTSLFNRTKFDRMRQRLGLCSLEEKRMHMIFTGNPGTGKTTVARIMGKVFKELGILSNGEVITAERADLVGKYIGHTEDTVKELLKRAKGNLLFIDEAYNLGDGNRADRSDYGNRVIETLLNVLNDPQSDTIVIMAGYKKEMEGLYAMNPGLKGRFPYTFNFEDYTAEQLLEICVNKLHEKQFHVSESVRKTMLDCITQALSSKDEHFHNARWAEQFVMHGIISAMADRLCHMDNQKDICMFCNVTEADVLTGYEKTKVKKVVQRHTVGFRRA